MAFFSGRVRARVRVRVMVRVRVRGRVRGRVRYLGLLLGGGLLGETEGVEEVEGYLVRRRVRVEREPYP